MTVPLQVAVEREILHRALDLERQRFYETAIRDPLTGLFSRYYMQEALGRLMDLHDRDPHAAVGVIMADIDHFKHVNDRYGHAQGDEVLRAVARCLMSDMRPSDLPVRLGGEEFAIFVVGSSLETLRVMAERLRGAVAELDFGAPMTQSITASFGVAVRSPGESLARVLERADDALYRAKEGGRNRVCAAGGPTASLTPD
ncbi:GGDEF domain-containing protein [Pararhodospirillum photometricum]|uniref:diguanylate cyclase n=1 Tax=Pararhodospirillum photometricum DSM 122 TaxID=1150469 RepID=H6SIW9_PARPM|nr:GGDEF domain-containing protein [Pararhodospirillum photometricum]CCG07934.1 GGDEF domain [Pararhodospirillum photometricum DSM 122]